MKSDEVINWLLEDTQSSIRCLAVTQLLETHELV
jgi:hypothetical protein